MSRDPPAPVRSPPQARPRTRPLPRREGQPGATPDEQRRRPPGLAASRQLVWVVLREPQELDAEQGQLLEHLRTEEDIAQAYALAQQFLCLVRQRAGERFDGCLDAWLNSAVNELRTFAEGLDQDYGAVRAALRLERSNGPVEGQVNRLKLLKRQMYGRASFDFLKQRMLNRA